MVFYLQLGLGAEPAARAEVRKAPEPSSHVSLYSPQHAPRTFVRVSESEHVYLDTKIERIKY